MNDIFKNQKILITGGTGSFGKKFIEILLKKYSPSKIIIYSRDEQKQFQLEKKLSLNTKIPIRFFIGDVRDVNRLYTATENVDIIIHAAALKHVPMAEYNPFEAVKTNIIGAQNVIEVSLKNNVKKVIALSTDKASSPINLYGATKLTSDKLFIAANNYKGLKNIKFSVVRYGNVLGSRGSVIPFFLKNRDQNNNLFLVTNKEMTRFSITLEEGVNFVIFSLEKMWGGEIFVPKIPSYNVIDIPKAIVKKPKIKFIGIRPGEKLHEEMISISDSINTLEYKDYFVIFPNSKFIDWGITDYLKKNKGGKKCLNNFSYTSKNNPKFLKINSIKELIKKSLPDIEF